MTGGEGPRPGVQLTTWHKSLLDDLVFRAIEVSTEHSPLVHGVETALWPIAAKAVGQAVVPGSPRSSHTVDGQVARG